MRPRPEPRGLDAIARRFLEPFLTGDFAAPGWSLVNWDAEQALCLLYRREGAHLLLELEERNDQLDCYARTGRFNVCVRLQFEDAPLTEADRAFVDRVIAVVRDREELLPAVDRREEERGPAVREILIDRVLMPEGNGQYYINPYVGCMIACPFCYVIDRADFSRRLEGQPSLPWGRYLDVKINAPEVLRREARVIRSGTVRMSPILTDPYQGAERRYRITRQCLEVMAETDLAPVVLTRSPRILEDLDLLKRFRRALVGFSIPTDDDTYRAIFESGADPIEDRLAALRALHDAGIGTFVVIQPVLPMNAARMVDLVAPYVRAVRLDRLYVSERVQHIYDAHGISDLSSERWGAEMIDRLARDFRARGVRVDPLDDFEPLFNCETAAAQAK